MTEPVLDCTDPEAGARFWCAVLDHEVLGREGGAVEIGRPGEHPTIVLDRGAEPKRQKLRLRLDVNATDRDQDAEPERLEALGARRKDIGQGEVARYVLEDPEGNEFCLLSRRVEP
ncbi:VOC family protein [Saccharothrix yanglingensis]